MTAAEAAVRKGGVIIMCAKSEDGHGGEDFYRQLSEEPDIGKTLELFLKRSRNDTRRISGSHRSSSASCSTRMSSTSRTRPMKSSAACT